MNKHLLVISIAFNIYSFSSPESMQPVCEDRDIVEVDNETLQTSFLTAEDKKLIEAFNVFIKSGAINERWSARYKGEELCLTSKKAPIQTEESCFPVKQVCSLLGRLNVLPSEISEIINNDIFLKFLDGYRLTIEKDQTK